MGMLQCFHERLSSILTDKGDASILDAAIRRAESEEGTEPLSTGGHDMMTAVIEG